MAVAAGPVHRVGHFGGWLGGVLDARDGAVQPQRQGPYHGPLHQGRGQPEVNPTPALELRRCEEILPSLHACQRVEGEGGMCVAMRIANSRKSMQFEASSLKTRRVTADVINLYTPIPAPAPALPFSGLEKRQHSVPENVSRLPRSTRHCQQNGLAGTRVRTCAL